MKKELELTNLPEMGENDTIVIKRLNYGEQALLQDKCAGVDLSANADKKVDMKPHLSLGKYKLYLLVFGIKSINTEIPELKAWNSLIGNDEATISKKLAIVNELDEGIGNFVYEALGILNTPLSQKKNEKSN